jgi:hypothetical protein
MMVAVGLVCGHGRPALHFTIVLLVYVSLPILRINKVFDFLINILSLLRGLTCSLICIVSCCAVFKLSIYFYPYALLIQGMAYHISRTINTTFDNKEYSKRCTLYLIS